VIGNKLSGVMGYTFIHVKWVFLDSNLLSWY